MSDDVINIEVDGQPLQARKGQMIIHVTDAASRYVPRFCYHEKLSIAANCRMCLVEVEKAPKPLPACATPVAEGMKVFTRSPRALAAQRATMEFLLINHPLDCPICDQGGECELQDLALGFGRDAARFVERKRVVADQDLGPLISTDMTRCIHCTRCVRFTDEIAGLQELGATGRGEDMKIGTWIERSVDHELSGNVIDLCPVGALNSKPFRHRGRSWEMTEHELVSPHDPVGSNLYGHVLRGRLMRVVPRHNEEINETWIADRDRFSYEGVYAPDRLETPMQKIDGQWKPVSWEVALTAVAQGLKDAAARSSPSALGFLGAPGATTEELYLLGRLARGLGSHNVESRLRQTDFRDQEQDPAFPGLGVSLQDVGQLDGLLVIGCALRSEAPMLAHRVRSAATRNGAQVAFIGTTEQECHFPVAGQLAVPADRLLGELAAVLGAASTIAGKPVPAPAAMLAAAARPAEAHRALATALMSGKRRLVLLGGVAMRHSAWADLRATAAALAEIAGANLGYLPDGGNAAGAALAGALPHRLPGGKPDSKPGQSVQAMLSGKLAACLLLGGIEPEHDLAGGGAALQQAGFVVALTPYASDSVRAAAGLMLPVGTFAETSGTYVNVEGRWQSFRGCAQPLGESRPAWKVLRVLGNLLGLAGFDYDSSEQIRDELQKLTGVAAYDGRYRGTRVIAATQGGTTVAVPIYGGDPIVRRATALQQTHAASGAAG